MFLRIDASQAPGMGEKNVSIKEEPLSETSGMDADSAVAGEDMGGVSRQLFGDGDRLKEEMEEVKPETRTVCF